jgi:hypothetical protein
VFCHCVRGVLGNTIDCERIRFGGLKIDVVDASTTKKYETHSKGGEGGEDLFVEFVVDEYANSLVVLGKRYGVGVELDGMVSEFVFGGLVFFERRLVVGLC